MKHLPLQSLLFSTAMLGALSISAVHADLIDVNFTGGGATYSGAAAIGTSGDQWNNLTSALNSTSTHLINSGGTDTGASLTTAGFLTTTGNYGSDDNFAANLFGYGLGAFGQADSTPAATSATLTFAHLAVNTTYELELYTSNYPGGTDGTGNVGRSVTFTTNDGAATALDDVSSASFAEGQNYVSITGTTDALGNLVITATADSHNNSAQPASEGFIDVMGVQAAEVVPEPATWAMLLAGLVSLVGLQRFKRKA